MSQREENKSRKESACASQKYSKLQGAIYMYVSQPWKVQEMEMISKWILKWKIPILCETFRAIIIICSWTVLSNQVYRIATWPLHRNYTPLSRHGTRWRWKSIYITLYLNSYDSQSRIITTSTSLQEPQFSKKKIHMWANAFMSTCHRHLPRREVVIAQFRSSGIGLYKLHRYS